ncbi:MAG: hypothetical protein EOL97_13380 [Spirochaetia bacterium]|nr:hypothetical protein [Spirochaetia bacterium]
MKNKNDLFNADKSLSPNGKEKRSKTKIEDLTIYNVYLFDNETGNVLQKISSEVSEDEAEEIVSCSFDIPGKFFNYCECGTNSDKLFEKDLKKIKETKF